MTRSSFLNRRTLLAAAGLAIIPPGLTACGGGGTGSSSGSSTGTGNVPTTPSTPPVFSSGLVGTSLEGSTTAIYTAQATVAAGRTAAYTLGGADAGKFNINASTGDITFKAAPSFGSPADADGDNEYLVTVTVSDGTQTTSQSLSLQVVQSLPARSYSWTNAKFGCGGYISGILYHPSVQGLVYVRTDVGGVYRRSPGISTWTPLNDDLGFADSQLTGVLSVAVDPNDSQKLYIATGQYLPSWARTAAVLRSSDRGATWSRTELPIRLGGNSDGRGTGERLAVDANKSSVLYLGTSQDGLYRSADSAVTWSKVATFTSLSTTFVLIDKTSGTGGTASQTIYVGTADSSIGLIRSKDGGVTWTPVPGGPAGLFPLQGAFDGLGNLYLTYANNLGPNNITNGSVWKLATATDGWSNITPMLPGGANPSFGYGGVSIDAQSPTTVLVSTIDRWATGDDLYRSTNAGATWTALTAKSHRTAPNTPWLTAYYGGSLDGKLGHWITDVEIDPFNSSNAIFNTGYGLWETGNLTTSGTINWAFNDDGIEETVITRVLSTKAGAHLLMTQGDVAGARYVSNFTDTSGYFSEPTASGLDIDAAELNSNIVVRTAQGKSFGAYISNDNGVTWSHMATSPVTSGDNGAIAVSANGTSMVWAPGSQTAYASSDGGVSWTKAAGYPTSGGMSSGTFYRPVADRAVDGYYYVYNFGTGEISESADGGKTFSVIVNGLDVLPSYNSASQLLSMPGIKRRDLWLGNANGLYHIDGAGSTAAKLTNVQAALRVGYGAPAPGQTYYALYIYGKIGGIYGAYRSDDKGASWVRINDDAHQFGYINAISGDPRAYGRLYLGTSGRGTLIGNR